MTMASLSLNISVALLQLMANSSARPHLQQLQTLQAIIGAAVLERRVETIAYFGHSTLLEPYIGVAAPTPKVVVTDTFGAIDFNAGAQFNRNIFFVAVGGLDQRALWNHLNHAFAGIQGYARGVFVVVHRSTHRGALNLGAHFEWCWRNGFANVLVLVASAPPEEGRDFDVYSYSWFPQLRILPVSPLRPHTNYFVNRFANLLGYRLRSPVQYDPPRVFERPASGGGGAAAALTGYAALLVQAFLRKHNAELEVVQYRNSSRYNILGIVELLRAGEADFAMNPYMPYVGVRLSYPLKMMQWCILVPFSGEIGAYTYFLRPFQVATWQCCMAGLLGMGLLRGLADRFRRRRQRRERTRADFGRAYLEVLRILLFLPTPTERRQQQRRWQSSLSYVQLATLGFILSNLYLASLTSFLAKRIYRRQLDTLQEMVELNRSIHANDYEIPTLLSSRDLPPGFGGLLVPRRVEQLVDDIIELRPTHAYTAREDMINFALAQQHHLQRPLLHVAGECVTTVPVGFLLPSHSQFDAILNRFILSAACSGLVDKWVQMATQDGFAANILRIRQDQLASQRALRTDHFQFAWFVLGVGCSLAALCFALENVRRVTRRTRLFIIYY